MVASKRGRGRPVIYSGWLEKQIVRRIVAKKGLKFAQADIAKNGIQLVPGGKMKRMEISLPTMGKLASRNSLKLQKGRRPAAA